MRARRNLPTPLEIRRGDEADRTFIARLATEVFAWLGDYSTALPAWLEHEGVRTHVAVMAGVHIGFTMIAYYPRGDEHDGSYVADLLCIAVAPEGQGQGVGRALLTHALAEARAMRLVMPVTELRLSVAAENERARRLFTTFGFAYVPGDHGQYDRGQQALHMARPLP